MSEDQTVQIVVARKTSKRTQYMVLILVLIALLAAIYFFVLKSEISSQKAMVDGMVFTVSPDISAPVTDLLVQEGSTVRSGQVVARLDASAYKRQLQNANRELSSLRPPEMGEISRRLKSAEEAEHNAAKRIAKVRSEEEAKQREMEAHVLEHVQAQLAMRALAHLGPNHPDYKAAAQAEQTARKAMERSREEFERSSRVRASLSGELQRIHNEVLEGKRLASRSRYMVGYGEDGRAGDGMGIGDVRTPVDGTVVKINAKPGQQVQQGDPLLLIMPQGQEKSLWVMAWFPVKERKRLHPGLDCKVERESDGRNYTGKIESIHAPSPIKGFGGESMNKGQELFLPVQVRLDSNEGLSPGDNVRCRVHLNLL